VRGVVGRGELGLNEPDLAEPDLNGLPGLLLGRAPPARGLPLLVVKGREPSGREKLGRSGRGRAAFGLAELGRSVVADRSKLGLGRSV